ncbi:MAG: hypothetical protein WAL97_07050 [Halobacteriota archaeon]
MNKRLLVQEVLRASENPRHPIGRMERLGSMNSGRRLSDSSAGISEQRFDRRRKATTILMG